MVEQHDQLEEKQKLLIDFTEENFTFKLVKKDQFFLCNNNWETYRLIIFV